MSHVGIVTGKVKMLRDSGVTLAPNPPEPGSTVARVLAQGASRRKAMTA